MKKIGPDEYIRKSIWLILVFLTNILYSQPGNGYVNPLSYTKGDTVKFHISTKKQFFSMRIFRQGSGETTVGVYDSIPGGLRSVPDSVWEKGCSWPVSFKVVIPDSWMPGAYVVRIPDTAGINLSNIVFMVKEKNPGSYSKLLVVMPYFNWIAYNNWGGKNVYDDNSTDSKRAYRVSLNRPFVGNGYSEFRAWPEKLIMWLEKNNYKYEVASEMDIHKDPEFLKNYKTVIVAGHDEYFSRRQRLNIQKFISEGGRYMSLSGNTCWWQVRFEDNNNTMICYKNRLLDPLNGVVDSLVSVNWYDQPLNYPENIFLGASFRNGGYVNDIHHSDFTFYQGFGDYAVFNSQNWIYEGTGLKDGDEFGRPDSFSAIVGYEVDGTLHKWNNGIPEVTGQDSTPLNYRILGLSPAIGQGDIKKDRYGSMGIMYSKAGGAVFNSATINWASALSKDSTVEKITKNIINRFMGGNFPPEITGWSPFVLVQDTVNDLSVQLNKRETTVNQGDTVKFSIRVQDPYYEIVRYVWYVDSLQVSTDSVLTYIPKSKGSYRVTAYGFNSKDTSSLSWKMTVQGTVGIAGKTPVPLKYNLEQNYPNPFNPSTTIKYTLAHESNIKLIVFNAIGQEIARLVDKVEPAGNYNVTWDSRGIPSGIYFYRIEASSIKNKEAFSTVKKMIILK